MPFVLTLKLGMPVSFSTSYAMASRSTPVIAGSGDAQIATKFGFSSDAAMHRSCMNLSSLPMMASLSVKPEIYIILSLSYQRGSS